jgi:hypothetical protein
METTATYYVVEKDGMLELRQTRFKETFYDKGLNHPHDVCAVARNVDELKGMVQHWPNSLKGDIDFTTIEKKGDHHEE